MELAHAQISGNGIGDFKLAPRGRLQGSGDIDNLPVEKIKPGNRPFGFRRAGLFSNGDRSSFRSSSTTP